MIAKSGCELRSTLLSRFSVSFSPFFMGRGKKVGLITCGNAAGRQKDAIALHTCYTTLR
jgi:hypothetical protein